MGRDRKNENTTESFAKWVKAHRFLPAWKALTFPAREAYFHFAVRCFAETAQNKVGMDNNNGVVFRSPRKLAEDMGCSPNTAMAAVADLQAKGWLVCTQVGSLGVEGKGKTAHFRLSMMPMGKGKTFCPQTQDPRNWKEGKDYPVLAYPTKKPKPRTGRIKNISPHPNRTQACIRIERTKQTKCGFPASESDTENTQKHQIPASEWDAYLLHHIPQQNRIPERGLVCSVGNPKLPRSWQSIPLVQHQFNQAA